jgi:hypothetical protein
VSDLPIATQRFNQMALSAIKIPKHFIPFQQFAKLDATLVIFTIKQQPHILYDGTRAAVIKIHKQHPVIAAKNITSMTVTVQPNGVYCSGIINTCAARANKIRYQAVPGWSQVMWNPVTFNQ